MTSTLIIILIVILILLLGYMAIKDWRQLQSLNQNVREACRDCL